MRLSLPLACLTLAAAPLVGLPAHAASVEIETENPVVELSVSQSVEREPDTIGMSAGVTTEAQTASDALRQNSQAMNRVIARLEALGVDEKDIQTTGIRLNPRFDYDQETSRQIFRGYTASNQVSVTFRQIEEVGGILDALVEVGANDISGPNFSLDDDTEAKAEARQLALQMSRERAMEYARFAGYSNVRVLQIAESINSRERMQSDAIMVQASRKGASSAPIRPGQIDVTANVSVTYEMVN